MVEYNNALLDNTFMALADPTRRRIIGMLMDDKQYRIKDIAEPFDISFSAVSKHIKILERAEIVIRSKQGREHYLELNPIPLKNVKDWVSFYEKFWMERFSALEKLLQSNAE